MALAAATRDLVVAVGDPVGSVLDHEAHLVVLLSISFRLWGVAMADLVDARDHAGVSCFPAEIVGMEGSVGQEDVQLVGLQVREGAAAEALDDPGPGCGLALMQRDCLRRYRQ